MKEQRYGWRTRNVGRLLLCSTDAFVTEKFREMGGDRFGAVSQHHLALIQNIDFEGTRLTVAAARARMTKQSMLAIVHRAELLGLVERRPDPEDGRAKIIAFTGTGLDMMELLRDGITRAEQQMAAVVGTAFLTRLRKKLADYVSLNDDAGPALKLAGANAAWRTHNIGRLLSSAFKAFTLDVQRGLPGSGFPDVSEVHMTLFRNLDIEGTRPSDLAARARMTKQAMTDLVRRTALLGLIERSADPHDGRAQIIVLTPHGKRLVDATRRGVERAERHMADLVGAGIVAEIKRTLPAYVASVRSPSYLAAEVAEFARAEAPLRSRLSRHTGDASTDAVGRGSTPRSLRILQAG